MKNVHFRIPEDFIGKTTENIAHTLRNMEDIRLKNFLRESNIYANNYLATLQKLLSFFLEKKEILSKNNQ
jgi:hypothetical protein